MGMSTYFQDATLNHLFRQVTLASPTKLYIAVSTTQPYENGTGVTEPTDASYARLQVNCTTTNFIAPASGTTSNAVALRFNEATNPWNTSSNLIKYYAIFDAATAGNMLWFGALTTSKNVETETVLEIPIGGFSIQFVNQE